jgi:hypothetical protein
MRTFTVVLNILKNLQKTSTNFVVLELDITNKKFIVKHDHDEIHPPHILKI